MSEVILIATDTFNKDKAPYLLCSSFAADDLEAIERRETKYKDVIGVLFKHQPNNFQLNDFEIERLRGLVRKFEKSIVGLVECEGRINAWLFVKSETDIQIVECKGSTTNDVNYFVWTDPTPSFWDNADFLLKGEDFYDEGEDPFEEIIGRIENLESAVLSVVEGVGRLGKALELLAGKEEEEIEEL